MESWSALKKILFVIIITIYAIITCTIAVYLYKLVSLRRSLKNRMRSGKYVTSHLYVQNPSNEELVTRMKELPPGLARKEAERSVHMNYLLAEKGIVEFDKWVEDREDEGEEIGEDEEAVYAEMRTSWCMELQRLVQLRKEALVAVVDRVCEMGKIRREERKEVMNGLYWEHSYLVDSVRRFWVEGWVEFIDEYWEKGWEDEKTELDELLESTIARVPWMVALKKRIDEDRERDGASFVCARGRSSFDWYQSTCLRIKEEADEAQASKEEEAGLIEKESGTLDAVF